ncbi:hypothetical protein JG688_00010361 [Phytophthora aleatoria]|uniref:DUF6570 domain-containing protein n=1 Tax=Phytophthora aleatoria TaxID=2496075 RepID=A0A8J5J5R0_9STRA|nr:hypothetical protein JG688_00010361 [Phytophthora aleatoria]
MKKNLTVDTAKLPTALLDQYRAPACLSTLDSVLVSPHGIMMYKDEDVSQQCLPQHLSGLTIPERLMTQLTSVTAMTRAMREGRHQCIRSHCIAFDCTPGPPVSLFPRSVDAVISYRVVMVGELTAAQVEHVQKLHRIRNRQVQDLFAFYKANNHLYERVAEDQSVMHSECTDDRVETAFVEQIADPGGRLNEEMNREQESIRGESDAWRVISSEIECSVIERRIGLADDGSPVLLREHPVLGKCGCWCRTRV